MEWNVKNAVNRDVERQHLNKILKEIESRVVSIGAPPSTQEVTRIVERVIRDASPDALTSVKVTLTGDVSGEGSTNTLGNISIDVGIDPSKLGISEAPIDSQYYWRINGTWEQVNSAVTGLQNVDTLGIMVHMGGEVGYVTREIVGVEDEVVVGNPDGLEGNPTIGLAKIRLVAGEVIHSLRAVMAVDGEALHPDTSSNPDSVRVVGIALISGVIGDEILVQPSGRLTESSWSWSPGSVYCGDDGVLTQTPTSGEWILVVGRALSATTIEVSVAQPILRI